MAEMVKLLKRKHKKYGEYQIIDEKRKGKRIFAKDKEEENLKLKK